MELKKYDIVQANLSGTIGSEQSGRRPVVIIQNGIGNKYSTTYIVMPLSSKANKKPNQPTHTLIKKSADTGLREDSVLLGEQMRTISELRIERKIGAITDEREKGEVERVYFANW